MLRSYQRMGDTEWRETIDKLMLEETMKNVSDARWASISAVLAKYPKGLTAKEVWTELPATENMHTITFVLSQALREGYLAKMSLDRSVQVERGGYVIYTLLKNAGSEWNRVVAVEKVPVKVEVEVPLPAALAVESTNPPCELCVSDPRMPNSALCVGCASDTNKWVPEPVVSLPREPVSVPVDALPTHEQLLEELDDAIRALHAIARLASVAGDIVLHKDGTYEFDIVRTQRILGTVKDGPVR